jgi:hypothetical protein
MTGDTGFGCYMDLLGLLGAGTGTMAKMFGASGEATKSFELGRASLGFATGPAGNTVGWATWVPGCD